MTIRFALTAAFSLAASTALAETATPEGAARLEATFRTYLGQEAGVVKVEPAGASYDVTLDANPLFAKLADPGFKANMTPLEMTLTEQGGGLWGVSADQAFALSIKAGADFEYTQQANALRWNGIFDESLQGFVSSSVESTELTGTQTMRDPNGTMVTTTTAADAVRYQTSGTAAAGGGIDSTSQAVLSGYHIKTPIPSTNPDTTPQMLDITTGEYVIDSTAKGFRPDAFYKLIAWFVAHPSEAAIKSDQAGLKEVLAQGVPYFQNYSGTGTIRDIKVASPVGEIGIGTIGISLSWNGIVNDGLFSEGISFSGLSLPQDLVPDWAKDMVPGEGSIKFTVSQFDAAAPARMFIDAFDLTQPTPVPDTMADQFLKAFLPGGDVKIEIAPGNITAPIYDLRYEGSLLAGPAGTPTGKATVTLTGTDALVEAFNKAPQGGGREGGMGLAMARGMAKVGANGALMWELEATSDGKMLVNGTDMSALGGQ